MPAFVALVSAVTRLDRVDGKSLRRRII